MPSLDDHLSDGYLDGFPDMLAEVARTGRLLRREEIDSRRALGERAARKGLALRDVIHLYLDTTRGTWNLLPGVADAALPSAVRQAGDSVLTALDTAVAALAEGYERAQLLAVRQEEAARREFIDDLLYGRSDPGRLAERAVRFGLRLARAHTVTVAAPADPDTEGFDDVHPTTQRVERDLIGRFGERQVLLTTKQGRLVCIAPAAERSVAGAFAKQLAGPDGGGPGGHGPAPHRVRIAKGRPHPGPGGVVRSYEEALDALDIAARLDLDDTVLDAAELLVFPVLMRDRAAIADLVRTVLGPLTEARGGASPLVETLTAHADAGYNSAEAARRLNLSVRALTYRLDRIRRLTGYDPGEPLHRYTLETAALGARLLDWPNRPL